jgi:3-oxoadipate enol-lactonase
MPYLRVGSGEPVVLLHGLGEIKEGWTKQFELANQFELIIPDLRGHGDNQNLESITIKNFAGDVLSLLDELAIDTAHICGFSMGGAVAQEIYQQAPEKCHTLLLVSTFHYAPKFFSAISQEYRKVESCFLTPRQQKILAARRCLYSWNSRNIDEFIKSYKPNRKGYQDSIKACLEIDNRLLLQNIKVPTLVIGSKYDTILPYKVQISMHKQIPNSELVIINESGHLAKLEAASKFNQTVRNFINNHPIIVNSG